MMRFRNEAYSELIKDLLFDAFYTDRTNRGAIASIRQFAEIIVRKILDLPEAEKVTLGDKGVVEKLKQVSGDNQLLISSINNIKTIGNKCTHTQETGQITDQDLQESKDNFLNLYASIFIIYFKKYEFGTNLAVVRAFSILPPIIRYICLNEIYHCNKSNLIVIDKLSLVLLKAFDKEQAISWIEDKKDVLSNLLLHAENSIKKNRNEAGDEIAQPFIKNAPENMYVLCKSRILEVEEQIRKNGLLYKNFEQAKDLYLKDGILEGNSGEIADFNSLMEFVYLSRKNELNPRMSNIDAYLSIM